MDAIVITAVAENSLNPTSIEAAIRKSVLPRLFPLAGLDHARTITDQVVEVTRVGLSRDAG
jgi:type I restriction enzyme R subunit